MATKQNLYYPILTLLERTTNLKKIQEELKISKQKLNYYIRQLRNKGILIKKGRGWWEIKKSSKNSTMYGSFTTKDFIRGHAFVWKVKIPSNLKNWDKRIEILEKHKVHFKLVGILKNIPRIKILGRKVWLCNNHLRIFEKKDKSYYGKNAIESKTKAFEEFLDIIRVIENKFNLILRPLEWETKKEHYALIKNDLAISENRKGIIWRIKDETGEWLLIDDSLEKGGELENVGKKSFETNIPMQKWWNDKKENGFKVTDTFILKSLGGLVQTQQMNADNIVKHQRVLDEISNTLKEMRDFFKNETKI